MAGTLIGYIGRVKKYNPCQRFFRSNPVIMKPISSSFKNYHASSSVRAKDDMKDEYGSLKAVGDYYIAQDPFQLESGEWLHDATICYTTNGILNETKDNVIVVCHALTGNAALSSWWAPMLGPGLTFDTDKYFIVCANILGSCYGSTGPSSINPATGLKYKSSFPKVSIRDTVSLQLQMLKGQGIKSIKSVIGGSMGGMQAIEWGIIGGDYIKSVVPIGCGAEHTAWQIGISEAQRQAIYMDDKWNNGEVDENDPPVRGLAVARQMAMIMYRTSNSFHSKFGREKCDKTNKFQVQKYLEYQGQKFNGRFDAMSYVAITEQMDTHDIGRGRGSIEEAAQSLKSKFCVVGIDSDILYPLTEQIDLAKIIPNSEIHTITSLDGHDAFLLQVQQLSDIIKPFLEKVE